MALKTVPKPDEKIIDPKEKLEAQQAETAPKRRGRPPGSKNRTSSRRTASLEKEIGSFLVTLNFIAVLIPPIRDDALDEQEIVALARAIDAQCQTSPTFKKYVTAALTAGSGGQLVMVLAMIGARRAARHGLVPEELDATIGNMLASENARGPVSPFDVEATKEQAKEKEQEEPPNLTVVTPNA